MVPGQEPAPPPRGSWSPARSVAPPPSEGHGPSPGPPPPLWSCGCGCCCGCSPPPAVVLWWFGWVLVTSNFVLGSCSFRGCVCIISHCARRLWLLQVFLVLFGLSARVSGLSSLFASCLNCVFCVWVRVVLGCAPHRAHRASGGGGPYRMGWGGGPALPAPRSYIHKSKANKAKQSKAIRVISTHLHTYIHIYTQKQSSATQSKAKRFLSFRHIYAHIYAYIHKSKAKQSKSKQSDFCHFDTSIHTYIHIYTHNYNYMLRKRCRHFKNFIGI